MYLVFSQIESSAARQFKDMESDTDCALIIEYQYLLKLTSI